MSPGPRYSWASIHTVAVRQRNSMWDGAVTALLVSTRTGRSWMLPPPFSHPAQISLEQ